MVQDDGEINAAEELEASEQGELELVSVADFEAVDCEAPLAGTRKVDCLRFVDAYAQAAAEAEKQGNGQALRVYRLLAAVTQMHFKPDDRAEPYGPGWVLNGRRSLIPDDLRGEQSAVLATVASTITNPGLRARLADIAWLNDRTLASAAQLAIKSLCEAVCLVGDGQAEFLRDDDQASSPTGTQFLRRACQIAQATGWKEPEGGTLRSLIESAIVRAFEDSDGDGYLNIGGLGLDYGIGEPTEIAPRAEELAAIEGTHPETARHLWEVAARAHRRSTKTDDSDRCLASAAECYVAMAAAAEFKGMTAASWLMDAIEALRRVPGTRDRRQELEVKLREAQASISDEMGVISTEIDLTQIVDHSRKSVQGLTLPQALAGFAMLERSPSPESLRTEAIRRASENPLSSIIPMAIHDDEGKLIARSPGMMGGSAEQEVAIRHLIARHERLRRKIAASGSIDPARYLIMSEHPLDARHFLPLTELSPFVPMGHEHIYALGFARFFGGDFISALHILVPQLENSLRYVLKQSGIDPSSIQSDMTQESRTISVMLEKDRSDLERILEMKLFFR